MARHYEIRDGVVELSGKAFTSSHMRNDPLIFAGRSVKRTKDAPARDSGTTDRDGAPLPEITDQKGYLLIHDLW